MLSFEAKQLKARKCLIRILMCCCYLAFGRESLVHFKKKNVTMKPFDWSI
jgi:hypothetical protein